MEIDQNLNPKRENLLDSVTLTLTTVIFTLLIALVSLQVIFRVTNAPITATWTEPIARILFIVGSYFGAAVASRNLEHVRLTLIRERLLSDHKRVQALLDIVTYLVILLFVGVAIWSLYNATIQGWDTSALGGLNALKAGHIYLGILLGFVCVGVFELQNLATAIREFLETSGNQNQSEKETVRDEPTEGQS
ncbi:TRAP transporter small permease [Haloarcula amylovorans]|uniref:TRAP transporter small permease n=1 Tax=Haloarcula amylovorans TaxID=2562280 RepID=UPI001075D9E0|nr:TRAP transporter small permease subunit [Halomicroarcula amylolytica]